VNLEEIPPLLKPSFFSTTGCPTQNIDSLISHFNDRSTSILRLTAENLQSWKTYLSSGLQKLLEVGNE